MKITFFQHHHNGDLFTAKGFLIQVQKELPHVDLEIMHYNHPKVMGDLQITYAGHPSNLNQFERFKKENNSLYINMWAGCYDENPNPNNPPYFWKGGINLDTLTGMWGYIFDNINAQFGSNLKIQPKATYIPTINFNKFNLDSINMFLENNSNKKILICNGKAMSGQSFKSDMGEVINILAAEYPSFSFICTQKISSSNSNIFFTDDIINGAEEMKDAPSWNTSGRCDLNEISYLSEFCDVIIGKNSGPFIFCLTQNNLLKHKKIFISFNKREPDTFVKNINLRSKYFYSNDYDNVLTIIKENLRCI